MPQNPALILGMCCRGGQTIPSSGPQKAAWPHPAPSVWLERQRSANQSQFSCDTWVFQSWLCPKPSLMPWAALGHTVHVSPSLPFSYTDHTNTRCVSAGHFTDDFFPHFPQNTPRLNSPISSPAFGIIIQKVQSTRCCRLCPAQGFALALAPGGRRVFGQQAPSSAHPTVKSSSRTALLLQQPPSFAVELFFQSHIIRSSAVPNTRIAGLALDRSCFLVCFSPKGL